MMGFDGGSASGPPQPGVAPPMQPRQGMPPNMGGGPQGLGPPQQHMGGPYGNGGPYGMPQPSPHNHNMNGGVYQQQAAPVGAPQYNNSHAPLHSPANMHPGMQQQQQPPMHRQMQQQQHPQARQQHGMPPHQQGQQQMPLHHQQQQPPPQMNHARQGPPPLPQQQYMHQQHSSGSQHQPPQQQQVNAPASAASSAGGWQSDADIPHRREMIQQIVKLIRKDKSGSPEQMNKLPQMAKQLEVSLYRNATSFEEYMDMTTLKKRLQQIAAEVQRKTRGQAPDQPPPPQQQQQPHHQEQKQYAPPPPPDIQQMRQPDGRGDMLQHQYGGAQSNQMRPMQNSLSSQQHLQQPQASNYPLQSTRVTESHMQQPRQPPHPGSQQQYPPPHMQQHQLPPQQQPNPPTAPSPSSALFQNQNRNDPEWKLRVRHKQQRLLLLHHSAKCPAAEGRCEVTPHCADMKRLWKHMEGCKDNDCRVPHCFSSRAILSHYRKCKDVNCPACGPVRETVRKTKSSSTPGGLSANPLAANGVAPPTASPSIGGPGPAVHGNGSMPANNGNLLQADSFQSAGSRSYAPPPPHMQQQQRLPQPPHVNMPTHTSGAPPPMNRPYAPNQFQQQLPPQPNGIIGSSAGHIPSVSQQMFQETDSDRGTGSMDSSSITLPPAVARGANTSQNSEWQKIRHKQQRLLLLRHASRCEHEPGKCPVTPHCASMKKLWEHIAHCKSQQCTVQHCLSSRYVLSHYRRCKDPNCPACGPVRETIRKSHERQKSREQNGIAPPVNPGLSLSPHLPVSPDLYQQEAKRMKVQHQGSAVLSSTLTEPVAAAARPQVQQLDKVSSGKTMDKDSSKADYSLLNSFTAKQLETHLASLDRKTQLPPVKLKAKCTDVLKGLQTHQHGWVFNCPVDPLELGLPDYFDIIKKPMDLGTVQKRVENGHYHQLEDFIADCNLTFDNAMTYNEDGSVVYDMAKELKVKFASDLEKLMEQLKTEDEARRQNERACTLCGCEKMLYEPPVYFCNGMNCPSQRIRRNSHFFVGGNSQYFWCSTCFNELDDKIPIDMGDMTIVKSDLKKKKNDEVHEESWVQCDTCERWVHQICGLFNTRQNKEHHSEYCCPRCLCDKLNAGARQVSSSPPSAADLPRTTLSEWLEQHIIKQISHQKRKIAESKASSENIPLQEAIREVESGGPIVIRQVTSMDRKLEVRELMRKRYAHKNYPEEFPFRCKCLVVFQELDGVDVLLFALYVYEHGEDNPPPNQRCIYISYLDSVHFMRPRKLRTFVYHEILIAYLDYARRKGFSTAHIWACPPLKGDDYIFYCKPEDQKTPRDARLRMWYIDMLVECQRRSIVGKVTNMYDLYFANDVLDATAVPYMEGDYFPGEVENIIKMIEDGCGKKSGGGGKKKKSKNSKSKGSTGTRSSGIDEESLIASGMYEGVRNFKDLDRDQVMVKLGETIQPMKDSFIVAFLNWSGAKDEDMVVPEEIEAMRKEYELTKSDITGSKRDAMGNIRDGIPALDADGQPLKIIDDDAEDLDCEVLNNRQAFLNLCRGNHYQFDELRRSKHTSMMVLWHLHNRDAPKFVQQCIICNREILSGMRYHCKECPDYDICQECYKNPATNRGSCSHELQPIPVENAENQSQSGLTDAERLQRQRNLRLHIQLIEHASRCNSTSCTSSNCQKMKNYLHHSSVCRVKAGGGCKICKRIWTLLRIHAQDCKDRNCPIPQCNAIREKMRQLKNQQQAMDDRRRLEMNRHMRFGGGTPGVQ